MKVLKGVALALFAGALLAVPALRAEDQAPSAGAQADDKGAGKDKGWGGHHDKFEHLKKWLDLSDDQVGQWKKIEEGQKDAGKLLRDKLKADQAQLAVLVDEKAADGKLTDALAALETDGKAVKENGEKQREAIKAILTPLQQAKMAVSMQGRGGMGKGGWRGKPGMHGDKAGMEAKDGADGKDGADKPADADKN